MATKGEGTMYRLFVAIDMPGLVRDSISALADLSISGAKWVPRDQLHLTLRFIGDADEKLYREIKGRLSVVGVPSFFLEVKGIGHFPPRGEARVLWAGVSNSRELEGLQAKIEKEIVNAGVDAERRRFSPHITIARLRNVSAEKLLQLAERNREFNAGIFPVKEFYLYSSTLSREGAIHKREAVYPLE